MGAHRRCMRLLPARPGGCKLLAQLWRSRQQQQGGGGSGGHHRSRWLPEFEPGRSPQPRHPINGVFARRSIVAQHMWAAWHLRQRMTGAALGADSSWGGVGSPQWHAH